MPYDFNIYHSQVTPKIPDYDTITLPLSSDLEDYATKSYVNNFGDSKYLSLSGGTLQGDLILANQGGIAKSLILNSAAGLPVAVRAGITFINALTSETGIIVPGLLITDGRLDITPDPIFNRAEFRIQGASSQFNIFNINTFEFYMRINPDTSVMFGQNTVALSAGAFATGVGTSATNIGAHTEGNNTQASGSNSHAEGSGTTASGDTSHAEGARSIASGFVSHAEGYETVASGSNSHAEGYETVASGGNSHAEGEGCAAASSRGHAEGSATVVGRKVNFSNYNPTTKTFTFSPANSAFIIALPDGIQIKGTSFTGPVNNFTAKILSIDSITGAISADVTPEISFSTNDGYLVIPAGDGGHSEGFFTEAIGTASHAEGNGSIALGNISHAAGYRSLAAQNYTYIWSDGDLGTSFFSRVSTTRSGQYMVSASGGMFIPGKVGIGTDSIANALTIVGDISASGRVYSTGNVSSLPDLETPTTSISSINNIVALSQATYDALTVKLPSTLYVIV